MVYDEHDLHVHFRRSHQRTEVPEGVKATVSGVAGAGAGYGLVALSGLSAAGMVGGGAGVGCAAGPVGIVVGGLAGLALYGITRAFFGK